MSEATSSQPAGSATEADTQKPLCDCGAKSANRADVDADIEPHEHRFAVFGDRHNQGNPLFVLLYIHFEV